jgi:hypothetical protein
MSFGAITFAMVNILPEPVTPKRVRYWSPAVNSAMSFSIASGCEPAGVKEGDELE